MSNAQAQDQQQQQQSQTPVKGTPEYNRMMVELYEKQGGEFDPAAQTFKLPAQAAQRPEWFPENLWDPKATFEANTQKLANSYGEARKAISQKGGDKGKQGDAQQQQAQGDGGDAQNAVKAAGLDWDDLGQKIATKGAIEDTDYAALEKVGIPRDVVDTYVSSLTAARAAARAASEAHVGGKETLEAILQKASTELSPEEVKSYNALLASKDEKTWKSALDVLKQRFAPGDGEPGDLLAGGGGQSVAPFASQYEQTEAINKRDSSGRRLYDVDPAYRNLVRQRIALSK